MRTDLLSRRMFAMGCFGLPWLWICHVLYWRGNREENNEGLVNPDDHFPDESVPEATPEEIQRHAEKWVRRCRTSAFLVVLAWIGWIVTAQVLRGVLPASLYMFNSDDAALTGW